MTSCGHVRRQDKMIYTRDALLVQLETCSVYAAITCVQMVGIAPFDEQNLNRSQSLQEPLLRSRRPLEDYIHGMCTIFEQVSQLFTNQLYK